MHGRGDRVNGIDAGTLVDYTEYLSSVCVQVISWWLMEKQYTYNTVSPLACYPPGLEVSRVQGIRRSRYAICNSRFATMNTDICLPDTYIQTYRHADIQTYIQDNAERVGSAASYQCRPEPRTSIYLCTTLYFVYRAKPVVRSWLPRQDFSSLGFPSVQPESTYVHQPLLPRYKPPGIVSPPRLGSRRSSSCWRSAECAVRPLAEASVLFSAARNLEAPGLSNHLLLETGLYST
ncbi:hypothetical protein F4825DRAFT_218626 [Nemania diffusa]|nr:hypothetical protein F4825DRAFT_218626 [Nemania diffusa]